MRAGFASCHRMGGDLFFKPSGLFFPRLTNQHALSFGPRIGSRRFIEAHREISEMVVSPAPRCIEHRGWLRVIMIANRRGCKKRELDPLGHAPPDTPVFSLSSSRGFVGDTADSKRHILANVGHPKRVPFFAISILFC